MALCFSGRSGLVIVISFYCTCIPCRGNCILSGISCPGYLNCYDPSYCTCRKPPGDCSICEPSLIILFLVLRGRVELPARRLRVCRSAAELPEHVPGRVLLSHDISLAVTDDEKNYSGSQPPVIGGKRVLELVHIECGDDSEGSKPSPE